MTALAVILSLVYLTGLAVLARRTGSRAVRPTTAAWRYALGLGVYCSSWTFFGAVGRASTSGWDYVPIYLGPILLFVFGHGGLQKLWRVTKRTRSTSIAEVLAARYGNRRVIAVVATLVSLAAVIPYLALQLKAIGTSLSTVGGTDSAWGQGSLLGWALGLGVFAAWISARGPSLVGPRAALVNVISIESVAKILALGLVAVVALWLLATTDVGTVVGTPLAHPPSQAGFWLQALVASLAVICLPRQFHMTFAEGEDLAQLRHARVVFPVYLTLMTLFVIPITIAGQGMLAGGSWAPDTYVLVMPQQLGMSTVTMLAYLGGFSAATAMLIVSTYAVGQMVSHTIAIPLLLRLRRGEDTAGEAGVAVRVLRQVVIVSVVLAGYVFLTATPATEALSQMGLTAFSLIVQLAPPLVLGLYWRHAHHTGAIVGIALGVIVWFFWVLLPALGVHPQWYHATIPVGLTGLEMGMGLSLAFNSAGVVLGSLAATQTMQDTLQAHAVVIEADEGTASAERLWRATQAGRVFDLLRTFVEPGRLSRLIEEWRDQHLYGDFNEPPKPELISAAEGELAGIVGPTSARHLLLSLADRPKLELDDVVELVGHTTDALKFSESLLFTSLENIAYGLSVIDADQRLVAWNPRYVELFDYPPELLVRGVHVSELVRYNAERGRLGPGDPEEQVRKRIEHLRRGTPHTYRRVHEDGRVIEMVGRALPGGGFVTTFADITEHVQIKETLEKTAASLEERVEERTAEISQINAELRDEVLQRRAIQAELEDAKQRAEVANRDKTRFIAAASHDILQPLNAARLFSHAAWESSETFEVKETMESLIQSLDAVDEIMTTVFDIAKLDQGAMLPKVGHVNVAELFDRVAETIRPLARAKGLEFSCFRPRGSIETDPQYMRRILQNLLSNAVKYTERGRVLLGARRQGDDLRIEVWDTGVGIDEELHAAIFDDFFRVPTGTERGSGLGLGVVSRMATVLGHQLDVRSWPGRGSCFSITVPRGIDVPATIRRLSETKTATRPLTGTVLYLDDERENLDAMRALIEPWGISLRAAQQLEDALSEAEAMSAPLLLIVDHHLGGDLTGFEAAHRLHEILGSDVTTVIVTASRDPEIKATARERGFSFLPKPVKPAALKTLLRRAHGSRSP